MSTPSTPKKMSLMQLTILVAVNMMGSGIIMLPTNMAQVGAISLLSWGVTAVGSMAIAYGFAQCGLFNHRPGGMAAYAEDAYGKPGYFLVFLLYFFSLAIGNVAIAISAVGYFAAFVPAAAATPIATAISVIVLIWLTTLANFGGPSVTGKIGTFTVWGVIIPVAGLSLIGWFWFSADTFSQAWNPKGLSIGDGLGSSIALTLWAFLGMESAAQNSDAVENPKKNVPLACMFGTLGAAVVYVASTTVIQGIVPNAELAKSTGPFGLAYAHMFNPTVGSIIMVCAIVSCLGSLLGWQFTISQTAKAAADDRLFPKVFSKINGMGAPVAGMVIMGVVQSLMALSTISPTLSEQFNALVNLAVVTNVVPYVIALSSLFLMMRVGKAEEGAFKRNTVIVTVAMLYSVYAIYASGKDAVLGGMIVLALTYMIYGYLAPRFPSLAPKPKATGKNGGAASIGSAAASSLASISIVMVAAALVMVAWPSGHAHADTLDNIRNTGRIKFGYSADSRPFTFKDESGKPAGFGIDLCARVADETRAALSNPNLAVEYVEVPRDEQLPALSSGKIDVLCDLTVPTLATRQQVSYSIPAFASGTAALLRRNAPQRLKDLLMGREPQSTPVWRSNADQLLQRTVVTAVPGTRADEVVKNTISKLHLVVKLVPSRDYAAGVDRVLTGAAGVFVGDRAILMDAVRRATVGDDLEVLDRYYTHETMALGLPRDAERMRLVVDTALSRFYRAPEFASSFGQWFGAPTEAILTQFKIIALPE
ncbi:putrescine-ornithine antiporter [Ottowia sp.]|uniref:putrescine-ornithine antiporter n=1 Tax=Ottowia sp. TaxID=1898956 RepID=UPI003A83CBBA